MHYRLEKVAIRSLLSCGVIAAAVMAPAVRAQTPQTLNDATTAQLAKTDVPTLNNKPCGLLLGDDDPLASLLDNGNLEQSICARGTAPASDPTSGGGAAATPPSRPVAVETRLKDEEEKEGAPSVRGFFFTFGDESIDRQVSTFEDGYQSDVERFAVGFDRTVGNSWIAGIAVDVSEQEGDFVDGFDFESKSVGLTGYSSRLLSETASLDFYFGYAQLSNERQRRATFAETDDFGNVIVFGQGAPTADFDADQVLAGIQYSRDWAQDDFTFGPRFAFDWNQTSYDTYAEVDATSGLALRFYDDQITSVQFSAGLAGSIALSTGFGVVVIHEMVTYRYEADQDRRDVEVSFVEDVRPSPKRFTYQTEAPDREFFEFAIGATFILRNGLQVLTEIGGLTSHKYLDTNTLVVGFRKEL